MKIRSKHQRGQAIVMVTLVLFVMVGMLGLTVDLGWGYFRKKSAQAAADSAALAAAQAALWAGGPVGPYTCGLGVTCQTTPMSCLSPIPNPPLNNLDNGCLYAEQNGFSVGSGAGRQNVMMSGGITSPPPTAPGVTVHYWATARVAETVPQLFSAILGNTESTSSARATAGIADSVIVGSLILINRENDCVLMEGGNKPVCGVNLLVNANDNKGMDALHADGGILMASTQNGANKGRFAGENQGGGTISAPWTSIRGTGWYDLGGSSDWVLTPTNGRTDGSEFMDPLRGMYQPPPPTGLSEPAAYPNGVVGGRILGSADLANPLVLEPGSYYASTVDKSGNYVATGNPILITGAVKFSKGSSNYADYVFFGGISAGQQGAGATEFTFDPGRYVFAGSTPKSNGTPTPVFDITSNITMTDGESPFTPNSGPGSIFIFTDPNYVGYDWSRHANVPLSVPALVQPIAGQLKFGVSGFQAGNNTDVTVNLHGLNRENGGVPVDLQAFSNKAPILLWQDQRNSVVKYYDDPRNLTTFNKTCVTGSAPCVNPELDSAASPELFFKASPGSSLYGVIYQPRGAWTTIGGGSGYSGPLQIIAGAFKVQGNANLNLLGTNRPILRQVVALVE